MLTAKKLFLILSVVVAAAAIWLGVDWLTRPRDQSAPLFRPSPAVGRGGVALPPAAPAAATAHAAPALPAQANVEDMVLAAAGDPDKSFEAFSKIEECLTLEKTKEFVDDVNVKVDRQETGFQIQVVEHKAGEPALQVLRRICAGLTGRTRLDRFRLLSYAVDQGTSGALAVYIFAGPLGDRAALKERPDDPAVVAWRADALRRLDERIAQGYPDALLVGVGAYAQLGKVMTAADFYMEYMAANKVLGAINGNEGVYPKSMVEAWARDLSEQQKTDAAAQAERIFRAWKQRQTAAPAPAKPARPAPIA